MGGGLMQLVAYGAQDVYLTGNPQITFFKVVYRRHTNFSMECIEQPLDSARFGGRYTVQVLRNGDLAGRMYLKVTLPSLVLQQNGVNVNNYAGRCIDDRPGALAWIRRVGHALINNIECTVGGSQVDKHWGTWYDLWYELTHTEEQTRGYNKLIGDVPELTVLDNNLPEYTLYVPLQFWFNRNTGLALPLIALQYHEVRFNIEFTQRQYLLNTQGIAQQVQNIVAGNGGSTTDIVDASILVDYIYLDQEERRRMAQVGHEYLIEQVQFSGTESVTGPNQKIKLDFNHPCKELIWAINSNLYNDNNTEFLTYYDGNVASTLNRANVNLAVGMIAVSTASPGTGWARVDLSGYDANGTITAGNEFIPEGQLGLISWMLRSSVDTSNPNGGVQFTVVFDNTSNTGPFVNASTTTDAIWFYQGNSTNIPDSNVSTQTVFGSSTVDLTQKLREVQMTMTRDASGNICVGNVQVLSSALNLADASTPTGTNTTYGVLDNRSDLGKSLDVAVNQPFNYGADLAGQGNIVSVAKIQLNGHDRFDEQPGEYFNYVQPYQHHTHTPADGVNVYSFGLHPEQHQPSGTANLSRIDTTLLWLQMTDPFNPTDVSPWTSSYAYQSYNGPDVQQSRSIQTVSTNVVNGSNVWIFAFSYNVFRIMSGMGGLAYAN
jgi:hypothetical protein